MKKSHRHLLGIAVASCLMSACATTQHTASSTQKIVPKNTLERAIKSQLRSSFDYQSSIYISNDIRRDALAHATPEQLNAVHPHQQCEDAHDKAYIALLHHAKANDENIRDDKYTPQKEQIKNDFLACQQDMKAKQAYQPFDLESFYQETKEQDEADWTKSFALAVENHLANQAPKEIDTSHTALDAKKAELLHEYLIRPSSIQMVGSYQPLHGKITALPTFDYTAKNLKMAIHQPIYIDLKAEKVYLWADNIAPLNSQFLDNKLGDSWHNKWLYIPLNDGSLPKDFTKDLVKAYLNAQKEGFMALPDEGFLAVNPKSVMDLPFISQTLPSDKLTLIQNTPTVIKNATDTKNKAYSEYVFADTLFQEMTNKYPMLTMQMLDFYEREIIDGESVIHVVNKNDDTEPNLDTSTPTELKINSETLMRGLFLYLGKKVDDYYYQLYQAQGEEAPTAPENKYAPATHYGIANGKISWVHQRRYINNAKMMSADEPLLVDTFTQILPYSKAGEFGRLPSASRTPTPDNSVDLFAYQEALRTRLRESSELSTPLASYLGRVFSRQNNDIYDEIEYFEEDFDNNTTPDVEALPTP